VNVIAVDIGGTATKAGIVHDNGTIEQFRRFATEPPVGSFIERLDRTIVDLLQISPDAQGIGVSVAGFIDATHASMTYNPNLPWLVGYPLRESLRSKYGKVVTLEADSNAVALGEYHFGSGIGSARFLCIAVGTGIGAGFMIDGKLLRFTEECLGDAGHIIVAPGNEKCSCGGVGCAEAVATASAILKLAGGKADSLEELAKDPNSEQFFEEAGDHLGILCASLSSLFYPDRIALGGGVVEASDIVVRTARRTWERHAADLVRKRATVLPAKLAGKAPLAGAACALLKPSPE
jgi:glucokinase